MYMAETNTPEVTSENITSTKKTGFPYNKIAGPLIVVIIILALITLFLNSKVQKSPDTANLDATLVPTSQVSPLGQSVLSLIPNPLKLDALNKGTIDVNIETGGNEVTAVQLELQYDPSAITNVTVTPSGFFTNPVELLKRIDIQNGRITYMIGISPAQDPISGSGTVAKISFQKVKGTRLATTEIKFSKTANSESLVAATGIDQSVLKQANSTTINLQ